LSEAHLDGCSVITDLDVVRIDLALLFLAMKLSCSEVPQDTSPSTQLYQDVKSFYSYVEARNGFSAHTLQALLLIALYEMGHGIYPAAYLTVGNAARLGYAMGVHSPKAPQILPPCMTWTEQEERRRIWWGIVILDRFISIENRGKVLATTDPGLEMHLPTDDEAWDRGEMLVAAPLLLSTSPSTKVSAFARTCQAAHLLGKVVRHIDDSTLLPEHKFADALQLQRTVRAFADVLIVEVFEPFTALASFTSMAMTLSALLTLYDAYSCTARIPVTGTEDQLTMQKTSIDGLKEMSDRAVHVLRQVRIAASESQLGRMSFMVVDCVYQTAANCTYSHACPALGGLPSALY